MIEVMTLKELMAAWLHAKEAEAVANTQRLALEVQMYKLASTRQTILREGTTTVNEDGLKLTMVSKITHTVDQEKAAQYPQYFSVKYDYSKTKLKGLSDEEVSIVQDCVTSKPSKPSFKVEVL